MLPVYTCRNLGYKKRCHIEYLMDTIITGRNTRYDRITRLTAVQEFYCTLATTT